MKSAPLPEQPHIQDIILEKLDQSHVRVKVQILNNATLPNLLIQAREPHGQILAEMTVIETPDEWNSYVLHVQHLDRMDSLEIFAYLKNDIPGIFHEYHRIIPL